MPNRTSKTGSELFIVDNSDEDWKVLRYLHDWCQISQSIDIATGYFEIGALLGLKDEWQKVDQIRILMGDEVSRRTRKAFAEGLARVRGRLDASLEAEKQKNDFLAGVPAIVEAIRCGKIACRVYRPAKFHAKAYITHARLAVVGASGLVGSSNFTHPGLTENIELNVQITGRPVMVLQEWYEEHWNAAEDVTPEILRVIERHTRDYTPFEVYAKALYELHRRQEPTDQQWLAQHSRVYPVLDQYQRDGFHRLLEIAEGHGGAFLCDGVGLGKTFVGLMLLEYLIEKKRKRVALFVPKAARKPVWERALKDYAPYLRGAYSGLMIFNHTDLTRKGSDDIDYPRLLADVKERADVVLIDEAHHFRNPGYAGTGRGELQAAGDRAPSRYHRLFELIEGTNGPKQVFLLTATPVNNRLLDLQHMIELFSRRQPDHFKGLGIHSLPGHVRKMEKDLLRATAPAAAGEEATETNLSEVGDLLLGDALFRALVVQRSRAYVRQSQLAQGKSAAVFPIREDPKVAEYQLKKTYGRLLDTVEQAFAKEKPLFSLAIYYPLAYYKGDQAQIDKFVEGRQKQIVGLIRTLFLKRFESSAHAFERSCDRLLRKLLAFVTRHADTDAEKRRLERWKLQNKELIGYVQEKQLELFPEDSDEEADEDIVSEEMLEAVEELDREKYDVGEIINETFLDLNEIAKFLDELRRFEPKHDDKLKALVKLLKSDPVMKRHKVLVFTEFAETARYLKRQLDEAGIQGVAQIDSGTKADRGEVIRRFAPYYNGSSSGELAAEGLAETRVLISTDVLSEGLNLQDATRLINYDLHWNPVRLMQRIGRVDRRLNPDVEKRLTADHPEEAPLRGQVAYWNFLPPDELNRLLSLYARVTHKTLRISKTFGIEGKKLLRPEDDYEALKDFNHLYEGAPTPAEKLQLEFDELLAADPGLEERLAALPGRVFSGKRHPREGTKAVFFCFVLPAADRGAETGAGSEVPWTEEAGRAAWYLYDLATGEIQEEPAKIVDAIRCRPDTPRHCAVAKETLSEVRAKVERHIRNTYLKSVQAPVGVKPALKGWMELS
ncbi:MAG TPA: helicase-related protein [Gemmataceae bacterium]|nr:helicase-related protein [Gemmataceae bacterium]